MILQSLAAYYERLVEDPDCEIAEPGYAPQKISFALVLSDNGDIERVDDLRVENAKGKLQPRSVMLPTIGRSRDVTPQFMWDKTQYSLGRTAEDPKSEAASIKSAAKALKTFAVFRDVHLERLSQPRKDNSAIHAFCCFLEKWNPKNSPPVEHWDEMANENIVFRHADEHKFVHDEPAVKTVWASLQEGDIQKAEIGFCLLTGEQSPLARLHPKLKGVEGAQSTGAAIVSFNASAFESYRKDQSYNAPTSEAAAFAYTTALNHLLRRDSNNHQRLKIGDTTTVFWAENDSPAEAFFGLVFDGHGAEAENESLRYFLDNARRGQKPTALDFDEAVRFYILGLAPNNSRLSIRFWHATTVGSMMNNLGQHFNDLAMVREFPDKQKAFPGIWDLLKETARETKDIQPLLGGQVARAVFGGTRYPLNLLMGIINRIRADQTINYLRAAIIKAVLVRNARLSPSGKKEDIPMSLDTSNTEAAYLLGRLFAVLEKAQKDAIPGANATIKDRFYGSASATPASVFPRLLRLAQHHISKAEYGHTSDKRIQEIINTGLDTFPRHLNLEQQGRFAIGYYQQRQDLYRKKGDADAPAESE